MNIISQCCGLIVLIIIIYFYLRCKKVFLNTESSFFYLMCNAILSTLLDITSVILIYNYDKVDPGIIRIFCKLYLLSIIVIAECGLMYIINDVFGKTKRNLLLHNLSVGIAVIMGIAICLAPIRYHLGITEGIAEVYSEGPSVWLTYGSSALFLIAYTVILLKYKKVVNKKRKDVVFLWMILLVFATVIQMLFKHVLIMSFSISMGVLIIYIKLENPESAIDRESGLFNQNTFRPYITQRFVGCNPFALIMVTFDNINQTPSKDSIFRKREIINYLAEIENSYAFKTNDDDLYIVYDIKDNSDEMFNMLKERFVDNSTEDMKPHIAYMPHSKVATDTEDLLHIFRYANKHKEIHEKGFVIIDEAFLENMKHVQRVEEMVNDAIENNRIEVFYQPIYSTEKRIFTSAEALVRIRDDQGQLIPPATFIEIAERNGTILKLGEMVFENVCKFIAESDILKYGLEYIEVNLSVVQCEYEGLAREFISIMRKYNIPGGVINLEITETATVASKKKLINNMVALRNYGVGFSLDDFGTGQSNLSYIVEMPVDIVKFDRGMTNAYFESNKAKYVMDAAMHMIHGMKLGIVSEGVETEEQLSTMSDLGIQYIQGYYFSKPIPQAEYLEYIHKNNYKYYQEHFLKQNEV